MTSRIVLALIGVLLAGCSSKPATTVESPQAAAHVSVDAQTQRQLGLEVQPAVSRSVTAPIAATGQLQLNEDKTWHVGAVTEGRIVSVPVHLGESVKAGQILAQMHSHEVHDSRADRRQAVAELDRVNVMAEQALRVRDRTRRLFELKAASRDNWRQQKHNTKAPNSACLPRRLEWIKPMRILRNFWRCRFTMKVLRARPMQTESRSKLLQPAL